MFNLLDIFDSVDANSTNLDLTTKEGYDKAKSVIAEAKSNSFIKILFDDKLFDEIEKKIDEIYAEANKKQELPAKPSSKCTDKQKSQITDLVNEYVDTLIVPNGDFTDDVVKSIKNSMFEFACWIMNK